MTHHTIIVIGAGAAGLTAGRFLQSQFLPVTLLEKSRGPGGRMATKRLATGRADHGAPCLRLDDADVLQQWRTVMGDMVWQKAPAALDPDAFTTREGMNGVGKRLAHNLDIRYSFQVVNLSYDGSLWLAEDATGAKLQSSRVIVTSPLPQTTALLQKHHPTVAEDIAVHSKEVQYQSLWTAIFRGRSRSPTEAFIVMQHPVVASLYHQGAKGLSEGLYVLHTTPELAEAHRDMPASDMALLFEVTLQELGWEVETLVPHRWLYARVARPLLQPFLEFKIAPGLILAGDFCLGSSVMQAARSGLQAARQLIE